MAAYLGNRRRFILEHYGILSDSLRPDFSPASWVSGPYWPSILTAALRPVSVRLGPKEVSSYSVPAADATLCSALVTVGFWVITFSLPLTASVALLLESFAAGGTSWVPSATMVVDPLPDLGGHCLKAHFSCRWILVFPSVGVSCPNRVGSSDSPGVAALIDGSDLQKGGRSSPDARRPIASGKSSVVRTPTHVASPTLTGKFLIVLSSLSVFSSFSVSNTSAASTPTTAFTPVVQATTLPISLAQVSRRAIWLQPQWQVPRFPQPRPLRQRYRFVDCPHCSRSGKEVGHIISAAGDLSYLQDVLAQALSYVEPKSGILCYSNLAHQSKRVSLVDTSRLHTPRFFFLRRPQIRSHA